MLWAAREALGYARGRTRASLDSESMFIGVLWSVAYRRLAKPPRKTSADTRAVAPGLPWAQIVGMRHRLVHDYHNVDLDLVWQVIEQDLRPLVTELEQLLPEGT